MNYSRIKAFIELSKLQRILQSSVLSALLTALNAY